MPQYGGHSWADGKTVREMMFRVRSRAGTPSSPVVKFDRSSEFSAMGSSTHPADDKTPYITFVQQFTAQPAARQLNVQVGVADGPWETVLTFDRHENQNHFGASQGGGSDGTWEGSVQTAAPEGASVALAFSYTYRVDSETRLVCLKEDGTIDPLHGTGSSVRAGLTQSVASLSRDDFARIKQFLLQRRRYQWVEFRNVSLEPGFETSVETCSVDPQFNRAPQDK